MEFSDGIVSLYAVRFNGRLSLCIIVVVDQEIGCLEDYHSYYLCCSSQHGYMRLSRSEGIIVSIKSQSTLPFPLIYPSVQSSESVQCIPIFCFPFHIQIHTHVPPNK